MLGGSARRMGSGQEESWFMRQAMLFQRMVMGVMESAFAMEGECGRQDALCRMKFF